MEEYSGTALDLHVAHEPPIHARRMPVANNSSGSSQEGSRSSETFSSSDDYSLSGLYTPAAELHSQVRASDVAEGSFRAPRNHGEQQLQQPL